MMTKSWCARIVFPEQLQETLVKLHVLHAREVVTSLAAVRLAVSMQTLGIIPVAVVVWHSIRVRMGAIQI